ncbi:hypothetical protein KC207_06560 [Phycicoccus sp. BSK3Z-2]|uniref:TY-Chap N-terminal domain-containing protein n=1 Tax=Phycicoccus avicenniae TaxID=2828860 RepID=A0A941D7K2_9MICO|nr:hypothetical protein [Phycicoccus avicenniae]MBR7742946.1 hypothetical protein [Phycicoccus avicenniae]
MKAPTTWAAWRSDLAARVGALADGESLLVEAPERASRRAKAGRRLLLPAPRVPTRPWVRLTRMEDLLRGTCVGPEVFHGAFPWSADEHADLLRLGWHLSHADGSDYVRFWPDDVPHGPYLPATDAERAAAAVRTTVVEVLDPAVVREDDAPTLPTVTSA